MTIVLDVLIGLALLTVVATFFLGMIAFARNGAEAAAASNRFMSWRVKTQVIAVGVLVFCAWARSQHPV